VRPFRQDQIGILESFADQATLAIGNARLTDELQVRTHELQESLEHQTATSELLKVIGRSSVDLQPVFDTLAESAMRLCSAEGAGVYRYDGQFLHGVASHMAAPLTWRRLFHRHPLL
jgi:hypothetical protein